jgi:hypothetical protein
MATEREKKVEQETLLYENYFAQEMLNAGKLEEYCKYLKAMSERGKNGMTADEIEAVQKRAQNAAKVY